jgi:proteasome assembly chaperone (PAC2) family protein
MEDPNLTWLERPVLNKPYMIIAFSGWANAGEVATSVLWYMISHLEGNLFAELQPDDFYVYLNSNSETKRPTVNIEDGLILTCNPKTLNFWSYKAPPGHRDLIMVAGPEPEQGWNKLVELIVNLAREFEVEKMVVLGGSFDAIPHTTPPRISGAANTLSEKNLLKEHHIELVNYKGASSVHTLLMVRAAHLNIPAVSLWAHTPHYVQVVNFMGCYRLMLKLNDLLDLELDLEVARKDSEYLCQQIDQAIEKKPELHDYLKILEADFKKGQKSREESINQNIIKEIEDLFGENQS